MAVLVVDVSLPGYANSGPYGGLVADASGNLYGTCLASGWHNGGYVFKIVKTSNGYEPKPVILANFDGRDGAGPEGELLIDAAHNLIGTTHRGGTSGYGTVFKLPMTPSGYGSTPVVLVNFNYTDGAMPYGGLIADRAGNLYGTTGFGGTAGGHGTVFELPLGAKGYAPAPLTLTNFDAHNGAGPMGRLVMDRQGNLLGTTAGNIFEPALPGGGPTGGDGTVFGLPNGPGGYAKTPVVLARFSLLGGSFPSSGLAVDPWGDLFGVSPDVSASGVSGEIYTVPFDHNRYDAYGSYPPYVSVFKGQSVFPYGPLVSDGAGDLFGTTLGGGKYKQGSVFEIVRSKSGYSAPKDVFDFNGKDGAGPLGALLVDARGDLYGTTELGGASDGGVAFELTGTGFVLPRVVESSAQL
jgi:uncharacterized repeat protein (TIGR03803 family)